MLKLLVHGCEPRQGQDGCPVVLYDSYGGRESAKSRLEAVGQITEKLGWFAIFVDPNPTWPFMVPGSVRQFMALQRIGRGAGSTTRSCLSPRGTSLEERQNPIHERLL